MATKPRGQQHQRGPEPLSSTEPKVVPDGGHRLHRAHSISAKGAFDLLQVFPDQLEHFLSGDGRAFWHLQK